MIIPVIIGATGIVTRSLRKNVEAVSGKHSIDSLQKTAILGTSHIIRKVLQCEACSLSGGDHCWFNRITRKNRPVTRVITIIIIIIIIIIFVVRWVSINKKQGSREGKKISVKISEGAKTFGMQHSC